MMFKSARQIQRKLGADDFLNSSIEFPFSLDEMSKIFDRKTNPQAHTLFTKSIYKIQFPLSFANAI